MVASRTKSKHVRDFRQSLSMANFFMPREEKKRTDGLNNEVLIERPSTNSRKISASCIVNTPLDSVWTILTDYDNLATHVPNLVESRILVNEGVSTVAGDSKSTARSCRIYQQGAQKIAGFDFSASLIMDMQESLELPGSRLPKRVVSFKLVQSRFFSEFDGQWTAQVYSRRKISSQCDDYLYTTKLFYEVGYIR